MASENRIVTIFGGSGFVGRYVARRFARAGWRVRVACRRPNEAHFVRTYGVVGQVEPILGNIRHEDSVRNAVEGVDAVVNCVAIMVESGAQKFEALHVEAAERIARIAAEQEVRTLVHVSATGADPDSSSLYRRTKANGERAVLDAFPHAFIMRPSIIFGAEDEFFNRFAKMAQLSPVIPLVGAESRFQPVYVDDVAAAIVTAVFDATGPANLSPGIFELGGPETLTFRECMHRMIEVIRRRRLLLEVPFFAAGIMGRALDIVQLLTGGLLVNRMLTEDQVRSLRSDTVVSPDARTFADLQISPTALDAVLETYLYQYRQYGQYASLTESAKRFDKAS